MSKCCWKKMALIDLLYIGLTQTFDSEKTNVHEEQ